MVHSKPVYGPSNLNQGVAILCRKMHQYRYAIRFYSHPAKLNNNSEPYTPNCLI